MDHSDATATKAAEQYLLGEMTESQKTDFEEHFFTCPECADAVRLGTYFVDNAKFLRPEQQQHVVPMPARVSPRHGRRWRTPAGIAAGVVLALVGYQNLVEIPSLRAGSLFVTAPAMLKAPVRGEASTQIKRIPVHPGDVYVPLEMDLNPEKPFPFYRAQVNTPKGQTIMQAVGEAPPHGTLQVELPVRKLAAGPYVIVVRGQDDSTSPPGPEVGSFPVELVR